MKSAYKVVVGCKRMALMTGGAGGSGSSDNPVAYGRNVGSKWRGVNGTKLL